MLHEAMELLTDKRAEWGFVDNTDSQIYQMMQMNSAKLK